MTATIITAENVPRTNRPDHGRTAGAAAPTGRGCRGTEAGLPGGVRPHGCAYIGKGSTGSCAFDGEIYSIDVGSKGPRARTRQRDRTTEAPMPGMVLKILVKPGDVVKRGSPLIVLEAMKMEHQITAPDDGQVVAVHCVEGEMVQPGVELVEMRDEG